MANTIRRWWVFYRELALRHFYVVACGSYRILSCGLLCFAYAVFGSVNNEWSKCMNKEQIKGDMAQLKGKLKQAFGKLTDNDIMLYEGKRDQFVGRVVELQGIAKEEAEKQIKELEVATGCHSSSKAA